MGITLLLLAKTRNKHGTTLVHITYPSLVKLIILARCNLGNNMLIEYFFQLRQYAEEVRKCFYKTYGQLMKNCLELVTYSKNLHIRN